MSEEDHTDMSVGAEAARISDQWSRSQDGPQMANSDERPDKINGDNFVEEREEHHPENDQDPQHAQSNEANNHFVPSDPRFHYSPPQRTNSDEMHRSSHFEPVPGMKKSMTSIIHPPGEKWTLKQAARLIILQLRIVKTFSDNRESWKHICDVCKKLELHSSKFIIDNHSSDRRQQAYSSLLSSNATRSAMVGPFSARSNRYNLGRLREIEQRAARCPFCKLVVQSLDLKSDAEQKSEIRKRRENIQKLQNDIEKHKKEVQKCEQGIRELCEEHTRADSEEKLDSEGVETFIGKTTSYGDSIKQKKDEIWRLGQEIWKTRDDISQLEDERTKANNLFRGATCCASFQIDGREVQRDESGEELSSQPRTRRIQLRWSDPALETSYIVLVAPEPGRGYDTDQRRHWESDTLFLARQIRSASKNQALIKSWVELCHDHHGKRCNVEPSDDFRRLTSKAFFGVIDVAEMRLTALPPDRRYIALSYTWGQQILYTTDLSNIQLHQEHGGLDKAFAQLPKVVRDAISLVRSLGERYLWVDSLCIVQKNDISWTLNSSVMDLVYGNAYATICAAEGEGAQMGLRGLDSKRKVSQNIEECAEGLRLTVSHLAETYIERSRWNTRGWTFQERLLSRRCIIFAGDRVFFQCRSTALSEDIIGEQESAGWSIELVQAPLQMLLDIETKTFAVYAECVRLYSKRRLGQRRDILAAFRGMSNWIGRELGAPLHFGLPTSHFDLALLWSPISSCQRREPRDEKEREEFGDMKFPSWSWCGWSDTAIEYRQDVVGGCLANVNQWLTEHTWIRWYIRDGEGDLRPVWNKSHVHRTEDDQVMGRRWLGYGYNSNPRCDDYGRLPKKEYLDQDSKSRENSKFKKTLLEYPFGISEASPRIGATQTYVDQPYLQFRTITSHLRVTPRGDIFSPDGHEFETGLLRCDIEDYCGDWCGTIVLNRAWLNSWYKTHQEEKSVHEFIAISEAKDFSEEESDMWTYYVPREKEQAEWHLYYVLLITRQGGISYRAGLGKVFKDAFAKSYLPGKEWKEIILG